MVVELFQSNDTDIIDLLMRSFHKDYTLYSKYVYIPTLRQKVFLCVMRCDVTLYDYGSPEQLSRLCWCVLLLLCALWYCIELLLSAIIVQFVMPRARARLAAKWYWPIAPNSTQLTRTHHLSPGYWLQYINIFMLYKNKPLKGMAPTSYLRIAL